MDNTISKKTTRWPSPAKINLFLYITGQRPDGYHTLQTLFQFLEYGDVITITLNDKGKVQLMTPVEGVPNEKNLIVRAAKLLMPYTKNSGADISVRKRLPIGSGLGGSSSNAATTLIALNHLWKCGMSKSALAEFGLQLGADVPFFINGRSAFAEGIGEVLVPINLPEKWYLVLNPGVKMLTALVFKENQLPRNTPVRSIETLVQHPFSNDCEAVVKKLSSRIDQILSWLSEQAPARLTGTGSCIFGEFNTQYAALRTLRKVPDGVKGFVAKGSNLSTLHKCISDKMRTVS